MHQKNIIFFLRSLTPKTIYVVLQITQLKLLKLFLQSFVNCTTLNFCLYKQKLILFADNIGSFYQALSFFNFFDFDNLFFQLKKKKQILNKIGLFHTNIQEEKLLYKEELKAKVYKKSKRKYSFIKFDYDPHFYFTFLNNFLSFKNYLYEKIFLSNNNIITKDFFFNFLFNYFKHIKLNLYNDFFLLILKNFFIFFFIFNFVHLQIRLNYFFYIYICQQYIK